MERLEREFGAVSEAALMVGDRLMLLEEERAGASEGIELLRMYEDLSQGAVEVRCAASGSQCGDGRSIDVLSPPVVPTAGVPWKSCGPRRERLTPGTAMHLAWPRLRQW